MKHVHWWRKTKNILVQECRCGKDRYWYHGQWNDQLPLILRIDWDKVPKKNLEVMKQYVIHGGQ
jgi:hypothetical protein